MRDPAEGSGPLLSCLEPITLKAHRKVALRERGLRLVLALGVSAELANAIHVAGVLSVIAGVCVGVHV